MSHHQLRRELFSLLSWHMHRSDTSPLDTLNRLIEKAGLKVPADYRVREAGVSQGLLATLSDEREAETMPRSSKAPIVLLEHCGRLAVLDGQKRIARFDPRYAGRRARCLVVKLIEVDECES